jgi:uncharacterized membrane protein HdeD (DUF308 family)
MIGSVENSASASDRARHQRQRWKGFLFLSFVLLAGGAAAVMLPEFSTYASSSIFGAVLMIIGIFKIIQSLWVKSWAGFVWQELTGVVELVGGFLVYMNPLKGAIAISLLIAITVFVHGLLQIGLSLKVRGTPGWYWFTISGLIALCASVAIAAKLPYTNELPPGVIAGIALIITGAAYGGIALSLRKVADRH